MEHSNNTKRKMPPLRQQIMAFAILVIALEIICIGIFIFEKITLSELIWFSMLFSVLSVAIPMFLVISDRIERRIRAAIFFVFVGFGVLFAGYKLISAKQSSNYIAVVLQAYSEGRDYHSVADQAPLFVCRDTKEFVAFYIQELKTVDSLRDRLIKVINMPKGESRSIQLDKLKAGCQKSRQLFAVQLEQVKVDHAYKQRAEKHFNNLYERMDNLINKCHKATTPSESSN